MLIIFEILSIKLNQYCINGRSDVKLYFNDVSPIYDRLLGTDYINLKLLSEENYEFYQC